MLGLDDLQWADASSLLALAALARRLTDAPVALIGCLRLTPRGQDLERVLSSLHRAGARTVRPGGLSDRAVVDLVTDVLAAEPGPSLVAEVAGAGGNLATTTVRLRFRHDLIREAVYEHLPRSVRLALHREAERRLAQAGAPALQVAEHLARGAAPDDTEAIDWLTRAAREAAPRSPGVAAELLELERAQRCPALTPGERSAAWAWAGMAHVSLGDLDRAATAATTARSAAVPAGEHVPTSVALTSLAVVAELRGHVQHALELIDEGVVRADQSPDRLGHRYPVHVTRGHILMELDRLADARSTLESGRRISERIGARWALPSYQVFLAVERFLGGEYPVLAPDLVRLALSAGDHSRARQVTTAVTDTADVVGTDSVAGAALRCRGLLADDPEPLLAAVRGLRAVAAAARARAHVRRRRRGTCPPGGERRPTAPGSRPRNPRTARRRP